MKTKPAWDSFTLSEDYGVTMFNVNSNRDTYIKCMTEFRDYESIGRFSWFATLDAQGLLKLAPQHKEDVDWTGFGTIEPTIDLKNLTAKQTIERLEAWRDNAVLMTQVRGSDDEQWRNQVDNYDAVLLSWRAVVKQRDELLSALNLAVKYLDNTEVQAISFNLPVRGVSARIHKLIVQAEAK